jgi:type IV secretory pathway TraG/TraD family ATPase VirD4
MPVLEHVLALGPWTAWVLLAAAPLALLGWLLRGRPLADRHQRGAQVLTGAAARRAVRRRRGTALAFAGIPVALAEEARHFKLIGTTGTGKSTAIAALLEGALERGDRAVVTDPDGAYRARFYQRRRGDVVLNPFDAHSVQWDPFAEITDPWDVEQLASGLIPTSDDASGREWRGYARTFLSALMRRCCESGCREARELYRLLTIADSTELRALVAGSPAQPFLEAENARMFASIRSVAVAAASALEYVQAQRARPFAVRQWVRTGRGVLFLPYGAAQIAALRGIIAGWLRLAIFECLNGGNDGRPLWFIVDELDALGQIDGLKDALARLRKFAGRCVLGFQSIAQVSCTYGAGEAQTLVENCGNTLILRCSGSEHGGTSQFASRLIGERDVLRRQTARSRDRGASWSRSHDRRSLSVSQLRVTEAAVLPAELEQLPDLTGYVKTAFAADWLRVRFRAAR